MELVDGETRCPRCGHKMKYNLESRWSLHGVATIIALCTNCLHTERIVTGREPKRKER